MSAPVRAVSRRRETWTDTSGRAVVTADVLVDADGVKLPLRLQTHLTEWERKEIKSCEDVHDAAEWREGLLKGGADSIAWQVTAPGVSVERGQPREATSFEAIAAKFNPDKEGR